MNTQNTASTDHKLIQHELIMMSSTPSSNSSNITPLTTSSTCSISYTASPDVSFNSLSSLSVRSSPLNGTTTTTINKPHKANQAAWEAMKLLRGERGGRIGLESFHLLKRVGSGDIGNVYLCQLRSPDVVVDSRHCLYAMKVVDREALACRNKLQRAEMEKEILAILDHPFLPTLYAEFESSRYSCLVMEYCPGGDLHALRQCQLERRFSLSSAKFYVAEVLLALEYLHMMGVVYRDLKPENVLVREDGHIMLSDFDLALKCDVTPKFIKSQPVPQKVNTNTSKSMPNPCALPTVMSCFSTRKQDNTTKTKTSTVSPSSNQISQESNPEVVVEPTNARSKSFVGTHEYLAPEVIAGSGHGSAVDWWTFGVFLYELIYGRTPFRGNNNETTLINIIKQPLSFPSTANCKHPDEMARAQDLIGKLLMKNPKKRIGSVKGAVEIKRHEFFKGVNWALIRTIKPPDVPKKQAVGIKTRNMAKSHMNMGSDKMDPSHFDYF